MTTFWNELYRYLFLNESIIPKNWQKCQFLGMLHLKAIFIYSLANDLAKRKNYDWKTKQLPKPTNFACKSSTELFPDIGFSSFSVIQGRIVDRLSRVNQGNFGDHKSVGEGISEMRLKFGSGYRIYYTVRNETIVFLLAGGDKSSQREDIKKAKELIKELP